MAGTPEFRVGTQFSSFIVLSEEISQWEAANNVCLYTRSSRSIKAHNKRATNRVINENLKFGEVDYACIHGGRKLKTCALVRPNQR